MIEVPTQFRPHIKVDYPVNNKTIFEEWFYDNARNEPAEREYLPVFWTSYQVNHQYGKDKRKVMELQDYINKLDRSKKYFSILQYDNGPLVDFKDLDIKIFGSGGGRIDVPIGLLTMPHPYQFAPQKKHFCTFAGSNTHPIREELVKKYHRKYLFAKPLPIKQYCQMIANSVFHLCPRGFGLTSFRICEALQYGAIPVYISDQFIIPYYRDFSEYGVLVDSGDIDKLDGILKSISQQELRAKQEAGKRIYQELFTYTGAAQWILNNL